MTSSPAEASDSVPSFSREVRIYDRVAVAVITDSVVIIPGAGWMIWIRVFVMLRYGSAKLS